VAKAGPISGVDLPGSDGSFQEGSGLVGLTAARTFKKTVRDKPALEIVHGGKALRIDWKQVKPTTTAAFLEESVTTWATAEGLALPGVYVHMNRDGSLAVATGQKPAVWPEDEPEDTRPVDDLA